MRLKFGIIWLLFLGGMILLGFTTEKKLYNAGTKDEMYDLRIPMFDFADVMFVPDSKVGEVLEGSHETALVIFILILTLHTLMLAVIMWNRRNEHKEEFASCVISFIVFNLVNLSLFTIANLITFLPEDGAIIVNVLVIFAFGGHVVGAGASMGQKEKGLFGIYNAVKDYLELKENYNIRITNLNYEYKREIS